MSSLFGYRTVKLAAGLKSKSAFKLQESRPYWLNFGEDLKLAARDRYALETLAIKEVANSEGIKIVIFLICTKTKFYFLISIRMCTSLGDRVLKLALVLHVLKYKFTMCLVPL